MEAHPDNAAKLVKVLTRFGFAGVGATPDLFLTPGRVVRMGVPPVRIGIINQISGLRFSASYSHRIVSVLDGIPACLISRDDLLANKRAAGRARDLNDLKHLEDSEEDR